MRALKLIDQEVLHSIPIRDFTLAYFPGTNPDIITLNNSLDYTQLKNLASIDATTYLNEVDPSQTPRHIFNPYHMRPYLYFKNDILRANDMSGSLLMSADATENTFLILMRNRAIGNHFHFAFFEGASTPYAWQKRYAASFPYAAESQIYLDYGNINTARFTVDNQTDLIDKVEAYMCVTKIPNADFYRNGTKVKSTTGLVAGFDPNWVGGFALGNSPDNDSPAEMDFYGLIIWPRALLEDEVNRMNLWQETFLNRSNSYNMETHNNASNNLILTAGSAIVADATTGSFQMKLHGQPRGGDRVLVTKSGASNTFTLLGNGHNIRQLGGPTSSVILSTEGDYLNLVFHEGSSIWM